MNINIKSARKSYLKHYLMLLPFFILFIVFILWPMVFGFGISFTKWNGVHPPEFVGIENYIDVVKSRYFSKAMINLIKYVITTVPIGIGISLGLALMVDNMTGKGGNFFRSIYFFPTIIPLYLGAAVWRWMLIPDTGIVNVFLTTIGLESVKWLTDPRYMVFACVFVDVWKSVGFNMVLLLAGLKSIPNVYYEAALIDGANTWQRIFYISIPQLEPILFLVIVNGFIAALQLFDIPWILSGSAFNMLTGGPLQGMLFPVMDIMSRGFGHTKYGEACAYAFILMALILVVTVAEFLIRRKTKRG